MSFSPNNLVPGHLARRRGNGKLQNNYWELRIELPRDLDGKRTRKYFRFHGTKKEADAELQRLRRLYSIHTYTGLGDDILLKDYLRGWLDTIKSDGSDHSLRQLTWEGYRNIVEKHLLPSLGSLTLSELQPTHISLYKQNKMGKDGRLDGRPGGLSANTVNKHLVVLNQALEEAASPERRLIAVNPMRMVKRAGKKGGTVNLASKNYLLADDLVSLLQRFEHYAFYPIVFVTAYTGMRLSEVLGLRWRDVNFKLRTITVTQSLHYGENGYHFNGTKNYMGRVIEIGEDVVKVLKKHKKDQEEKGIPNRHGLVFMRQDGMPHRRESISGMFIEYARRHGFNDITFHGLRHTHATLLIMSGVPVPTVRDRLGHSENSTTLNIYTHAVPSMQSRATRVFDEIIKKGEVLNEEESKAVQEVARVDLFNVGDAFGLALENEVNSTGQIKH